MMTAMPSRGSKPWLLSATSLGIPFRFEETEGGVCRGVVANHGAVLDLFARYSDDDQLDRMTAAARRRNRPGGRASPAVRHQEQGLERRPEGRFSAQARLGCGPDP